MTRSAANTWQKAAHILSELGRARMQGGFKMKCMRTEKISRRDLLRRATAVAGPWFFARTRALAGAVEKPFRGIFAILQTPFNAYDQIDEEDVEREVHFCIRAGAQGLVWPQLFSEFYLLSEDERMRVASLILRAAAGGAVVVIGVQAPSKELAIKFAQHAEEHGADAVIALPPYLGYVPAETVANYYRSIAAAPARVYPEYRGLLGTDALDFHGHPACEGEPAAWVHQGRDCSCPAPNRGIFPLEGDEGDIFGECRQEFFERAGARFVGHHAGVRVH